MSVNSILFLVTLLLTVLVLGIIFILTEWRGDRSRGPSEAQYGSGAYHISRPLPPISHAATSVPTGSSDASHWPASRASRNRAAVHHR